MEKLREKLFSLQDLNYRDFISVSIPNIEKEKIIWVRIPALRKFFKENLEFFDEKFLSDLPHKYHEENLLHIYFLNSLKDFEKTCILTEKFLPFLDNWAVTDSFNPKIFSKNKEKILEKIFFWLEKDEIYTKRICIYFLMKNFLGENFRKEILEKISKIKSEDYYLDMIIARFFAESLAQNYDETIDFIKSKKFSKSIQNKIISKARDSRKIDIIRKNFLKNLKI